jgi:transcription antitermination factor NusG
LHERKNIYSVPGVVRILSFNGKAAVIDDSEIEAVRMCLLQGVNPQPHPFPVVGERVRVKSGPLQGLQGVVLRLKKECRIVVSIALIHQSVSAEIDVDLVEPVNASPAGGWAYDWNQPVNGPSKPVGTKTLGGIVRCLAGA